MLALNEYLYLLKNLKGIVIPAENYLDEALIRWLSRRFRYRMIGVAQIAEDQFPETIDKSRLDKPPFHHLNFPFPSQAHWLAKLSLDPESNKFLKAVFLSSAYLSPLITTHPSNPEEDFFTSLEVYRGTSGIAPSDRDLRFNIRLGEYAMTDFAGSLLLESLEQLRCGAFNNKKGWQQYLNRRRKIAEEDVRKRYWRLWEKSVDENPTIIISYLDPLRFPSKDGHLKQILNDSTSSITEQINLLMCLVVNIQLKC